MIEKKFNSKYLKSFLNNLRKEDFDEISMFKINDLIEEIISVSSNPVNKTYFLTTSNNCPLALGGAYEIKDDKYKIAKVWLLTTNEIKENRKRLFKYVINKANFLKSKYDILFNFVYKSNFSSIKWLKKLGFTVLNFNNDYKLFYFTKGDIKFDLRYFTGK